MGGTVSEDELQMDKAIPITLGSRPWPFQESCFVFFLPESDAYVEAFLSKVAKTDEWVLCRTRSSVLGEDRLKSLFGWTKEPKLPGRCKGKEVTASEAMHTRTRSGVVAFDFPFIFASLFGVDGITY